MKLLLRYQNRILIPLIFIGLFALAFMVDTPQAIAQGYVAILKSPSVLVSDYLAIGGLGATLINVATILLLNILLIYRLRLPFTGPIIASLFTIAGFSFFGKNIFNTIPIYLGIYLYAKSQKLDFKSLIIVLLFSTGISPLVSFFIFGTGWPWYIGLPSGIIAGILVGFILAPFSAHTIRFHRGYNLYNVGFAMGVIAMVFTAIFQSFSIPLDVGGPTSEAYHTPLLILSTILSISFIGLAFLNDKNILKKYLSLLKKSGRAVSDFIREFGVGVSLFNIGLMGLISAGVLVALNLEINGPVMGAILTVMGFAAFGKHPVNSLPVIIGALLAVWITPYSFESVGMVTAILFVTAIAPIAGRYGPWIGILAGFLHVLITPIAGRFQGGFDLYNNGFTAGFVAALFIGILEVIFKEKQEGTYE